VLEFDYMVSISSDDELIIWSTFDTQIKVKYFFSNLKSPVLSIAVLNETTLVFGENNDISIWHINQKLSERIKFEEHEDLVFSVIVLENGELASASADKTIIIWNTLLWCRKNTLVGHEKAVKVLVELPNNFLASGSEDMTIKIWNLKSGILVRTLLGHSSWIRSLIVLPNGYLASSSWDSLIFLWDLNDFILKFTIEAMDTVYSLGFLKSGDLVSGLSNGFIQIWNRTNFRLIKPVYIDEGSVWCLELLRNGNLAIGLTNGNVNILKIIY